MLNYFAQSEPHQTATRGHGFWNAVARVHDQAPVAGDSAIVELGVVSENQHAMSRAQLLFGGPHGLELGPVGQEGRHVGVGVGDVGTSAAEGIDDLVSGRNVLEGFLY